MGQSVSILVSLLYTYHTAAPEHQQECTHSSGCAHDPGQTNKEDDTENVLDAGQKNANQGAHPCGLGCRLGVRFLCRGNRIRVVGHRGNERGHAGSLRNVLLGTQREIVCNACFGHGLISQPLCPPWGQWSDFVCVGGWMTKWGNKIMTCII